jgi:hypothetical protein
MDPHTSNQPGGAGSSVMGKIKYVRSFLQIAYPFLPISEVHGRSFMVIEPSYSLVLFINDSFFLFRLRGAQRYGGVGSGEFVRGTAMGMIGNVIKDHAGEQLHDQIALRGRMEVEEGMNALRGTSRPGAGEYGAGVGDHQAGYGAGTGAATGVGDATVSGYGTNENSGSPGVIDAKGHLGPGGGMEHPDSLQHTSADPPPIYRPEEEGLHGSTAPRTEKPPPPGV